jgi:guanylate kinase
MNKLFCIIGPSCSGKDTAFKTIMLHTEISDKLSKIVPYTTRPKRVNEINGVDYNFITNDQYTELEESNQLAETTAYTTTEGLWLYATPMFEANKDYILIATPGVVRKLHKIYNGTMDIHIIYLKVNDEVRLNRAISRERHQKYPNLKQVCTRFINDSDDFDSSIIDDIKELGHFEEINANLLESIVAKDIMAYIKDSYK